MLKLNHLFNNTDLAEMILKNWNYDEASLTMFKHYRISANAVYPFRVNGKVQLLRFAPKDEKQKSNILAELDFLSYLRSHDYGVPEAVLSHGGEQLVEVRTPWGLYFAAVFKRVPGVQLNKTDLNDDILFSHGKALGKLHRLSSQYEPGEAKRWSYSDVLDWIENVLRSFPEQFAALSETKLLREYFAAIPKSHRNYGLVHYDFEFDNVFYDDNSKSCYAIDFDDAMYHWYATDIEQALDSIQADIPSGHFEHKKQCFMNGYLTEYDLLDDVETFFPACRRFANLYGYVRILRSVSDEWDYEPSWLTSLREKLAAGMKKRSVFFGEML
ncbi:MAG: hypothetical protein K0R75_2989 [Paenibacillaceae bacterium]|nr:hypothetical protein [Paenibacillaceae bacterium]